MTMKAFLLVAALVLSAVNVVEAQTLAGYVPTTDVTLQVSWLIGLFVSQQ